MQQIFFDNWESIVRTIILTVLGYVSMIILLRISGKRTLSKMNAFDFIITIALGSSLATLSLSKDVTLADGVTNFAVFILLQFLLTWLSVRIKKVKTIITSSPTLIFYKGEFLYHTMQEQRVTKEEVYSAGRHQGLANLDSVDMVILETTGDLTIIDNSKAGKINTLENVKGEEQQNRINLDT
ncbi:DUF421 domain-containing protein [Pontibacter sp. 13R65]|uniref:DUF421 domain-containing protein n=1 Tax=Pontibacter sp. 13R65 TaxID=3127458 RepID=UPI00301C6EE0